MTHFGNFEYDAVYTMPVQFRTFYFKKLINVKEKEQESMEKSQGKTSPNSSGQRRSPK